MKTLNLKNWKDELHDAETTGITEIVITTDELRRFINEIENLRKKMAEYVPIRETW